MNNYEGNVFDHLNQLIINNKMMEIKKNRKELWNSILETSFSTYQESLDNIEKAFFFKQIINLYFKDLLHFELQKIGLLQNINLNYQENQRYPNKKILKQSVLIKNKEHKSLVDEKGLRIDFEIPSPEELVSKFCHVKEEKIKYLYLISVYKDKDIDQLYDLYFLNMFLKKIGAAA